MKLLTASAFLTLIVIAIAFDALPLNWLLALVAFFLAQLGALWALSYSQRHGVTR
jgi:hypothetical protein